MKYRRIFVLVMSFLMLYACKKTEVWPDYSKIKVEISYTYNNTNVLWDTISYVTCYQDTISFSRLEYILSNIVLYSKGKAFHYKHSFYMNPKEGKSGFIMDSVYTLPYDSIQISIGDNRPYDSSDVNITAMFWPQMMGGGYHFLKLEGYYRKNTLPTGYIMHTGGNPLKPIMFVFKNPILVDKKEHSLVLEHKIDKWINGIICYKISNSNYSMGVDSLMNKIQENGKAVLHFVKFE